MISEPIQPFASVPLLILRLRALVLALGESASPPWWGTEFWNTTGLSYLERLYPRTAYKTAIYAAGQAACYKHDHATGRIAAYHLFRLPDPIEIEMLHTDLAADKDYYSGLRDILGDCGQLLNLLAGSFDAQEAQGLVAGAKQIGDAHELNSVQGITKVAGFYLTAFRQNTPGYPYFAAVSVGSSG